MKREAFTKTCPNALFQEDQMETAEIVEAREVAKNALNIGLVKLPLQIEKLNKELKIVD